MACLGVRSAGGITAQTNRVVNRVNLPGRVTVRVKQPAKFQTIKCSAAAAIQVATRNTSVSGAEKFDRWMTESVGDIVKNLREAPLFVHVYGGDENKTKLKTEKAVAEEWGQLKGKWGKGEEPSPEGIILVEELKEGEVEKYDENEGRNGECTKEWGVLIQGKGEDGGVACYLLKTSRVGCGNLGMFCTHFCLVKVKNFRESARSQLTSCWL